MPINNNATVDFPLVDFHLHLPLDGLDAQISGFYENYRRKYGYRKESIIKSWGEKYQQQWLKAWGFPEPEPSPEPENAACRWKKEVDKWGLTRVVFLTGGGNRELHRVIAPYRDTFTGFAHHPPEEEGAARELERAVQDLGLKGYKVFAPLVDKPLSHPGLEPLWKTAEKFKLPVLIHFGILGGGGGIASGTNINPLTLEPVARAFPEIPFVVPHFGCGYLRELLQLCWACANVHVDTSGNNEWLRWYPYPFTLEDLFRRFYETVGPERIIFGTDSYWFPRGWAEAYFREQLRACVNLGLPRHELALIFGGNALKLLERVDNGE